MLGIALKIRLGTYLRTFEVAGTNYLPESSLSRTFKNGGGQLIVQQIRDCLDEIKPFMKRVHTHTHTHTHTFIDAAGTAGRSCRRRRRPKHAIAFVPAVECFKSNLKTVSDAAPSHWLISGNTYLNILSRSQNSSKTTILFLKSFYYGLFVVNLF